MKYCRINLAKTNYVTIGNAVQFVIPPVDKLKEIFRKYCKVKDFDGIMPLFDSQYTDPNNDIIGYTNGKELVAFSLMRRHDSKNVESVQFAWDYENPKLRLGINSIEHECAVYKQLGYEYLYLGLSEEYKTKFDGYEEVKEL